MVRELAEALYGMTISAGFIEHADDGRFFNSQGLFSQGALVAVHRKLNLPGYGALREDQVYAAGSALDTQKISSDWHLATLICADAWNPARTWLAALSGINLLLVPAASALGAVGQGFDNPSGWQLTLAYGAMTYGLPTLFANHCGARGGLDFWGGSRILDACGRELARAGSEPELIVAELQRVDGEAAKRRLPAMRDSMPELVGALLQGRLG